MTQFAGGDGIAMAPMLILTWAVPGELMWPYEALPAWTWGVHVWFWQVGGCCCIALLFCGGLCCVDLFCWGGLGGLAITLGATLGARYVAVSALGNVSGGVGHDGVGV